MDETHIVARRAAANATRGESHALLGEPGHRCVEVVDPQPDVVERRLVDLGLARRMASCSSGVKLRSSAPTKSRMEQLLQQAPDLALSKPFADVVLALAGALVANLQVQMCILA